MKIPWSYIIANIFGILACAASLSHCRVGGIMCRRASANAPEFFLHHSFIDKIWANWQEYNNGHMTVHFQNIRSTMRETGYSPADYIDSVDLPSPGRFGRRTGRRTCVYTRTRRPLYSGRFLTVWTEWHVVRSSPFLDTRLLLSIIAKCDFLM